MTAAPVTRLTPEQRSDILARQVAEETRSGWRVVSQTQTQAQLIKGKPTSHLLHLVLTLITVGVWLPVWIAVALFAGERQKFVSVNEWGGVSRR